MEIHVKYKGLRLSLFTYNTHIMPMNDHEYQFRHQRLYQVCQIKRDLSAMQKIGVLKREGKDNDGGIISE